MVFQLLLAFFRLVVLSKRRIIEPSLTAFIGFPFALVFTCTFTECVTYITKYMSSTGIIRNFGRLADCDPISNPCLNADCDPISIKTVLRNLEGKKTECIFKRGPSNKGTTGNAVIMHELRALFWLSAVHNFHITAVNIEGICWQTPSRDFTITRTSYDSSLFCSDGFLAQL